MQRNKTAEMTTLIFAATERLMAQEGLNGLSMQKIAREAKISAGSIYVYFKNKEELLERLARAVFEFFETELGKNVDKTTPHFEQYRQMWWNLWHALLANPNIVLNLHQYQALPKFYALVQECKTSPTNPWFAFCEHAKKNHELCDLPTDVLFKLSLESAKNLAFDAVHQKIEFPTALLENVIERTWRAIQK